MKKEYCFKSTIGLSLGISLGIFFIPLGLYMCKLTINEIINVAFININQINTNFILSILISFFCIFIMIGIPIYLIFTYINSKIILDEKVMQKVNLFKKKKEYNLENIVKISIKEHCFHLGYYIRYITITFKDGSRCRFYENNPNDKNFDEIIRHLNIYKKNKNIIKRKYKKNKKRR